MSQQKWIVVALPAIALAACGLVANRAGDEQTSRAPGDSSNAAAEPQFRQPLLSSNNDPVSVDNLPASCKPIHSRMSPDGRMLAFTGKYFTTGSDRHGLFVIDLHASEIRQLSDQAIKMNFGWSPDSRKIAVANIGGYVAKYPLVVVDVETGRAEPTGIMAHNPAWSPDGTEIACIVDRERADGIPDGCIGVWNIARRELRRISPSGHSMSIDRLNGVFTSGSESPTWSPDGRRVVFQQHVAELRRRIVAANSKSRTSEETRHIQLWAVNRDGSELQMLTADIPRENLRQPMNLSDDGCRISTNEKTEFFEFVNGKSDADANWTKPPADFVAAIRLELEARERAGKYDLQPVLKRNRSWQVPQLEKLENVQFLHRMSPVRLDEKFCWRRDGACFVEVIFREDQQAAAEVGRVWALTPENLELTLAAGGRYPRRTEHTASDADDKRFGHLMGTRTSFVSLDWGRHPDRYLLVDARPAERSGHTILAFKPSHPRNRGLDASNAGAMFHTTSWSYVHHLPINGTELLIDDTTGRILQESVQREEHSHTISFQEWRDLPDGSSVPLLITVEVPGQKFHVEYRFQVLKDSLWILKSGRSWFDDHEPQVEEIVDLRLDVEQPEIDELLKGLKKKVAEIDQPSIRQPPTSHLTEPLGLGSTVRLGWNGVQDSVCRSIESVKFAMGSEGQRFREVNEEPTLRLELNLSHPIPAAASNEPLLLVLYDAEGRPLESVSIPITAMESFRRPAAEFLQRIGNHSRLWIDPDLNSLPEVTYQFHGPRSNQREGESRRNDSIKNAANPHFLRGITLSLGLDEMLRSPARFQLPVLFEAEFEGRKVDVAVISGPSIGWVVGNGIENSWLGYSVGKNALTLLVVDHETGTPLLEQHQHAQVRFLDYCEPQPGQYVPRRIVHRVDRAGQFDFRFQVVNERIWLFERSVSEKGKQVVSVDDIRVAGEPPIMIERETAAQLKVSSFDWSLVTNRKVAADATPFERELASDALFPKNRIYAMLGKTEFANDRRIRVDLGRNPKKFATRWSLGRSTDLGLSMGTAAEAFIQHVETPSIPIQLDRTMIVDIGSNSEKSRLRSVQVSRKVNGEWIANVEIVSQDYNTEQSIVVAAVMVDQRGAPVATAGAEFDFVVFDTVYSNNQIALNFGMIPAAVTPHRLLLGMKSQMIGSRSGQIWLKSFSSNPILPIGRMLASDHRDVWAAGLREFYYDHDQVLTPLRFTKCSQSIRGSLSQWLAGLDCPMTVAGGPNGVTGNADLEKNLADF